MSISQQNAVSQSFINSNVPRRYEVTSLDCHLAQMPSLLRQIPIRGPFLVLSKLALGSKFWPVLGGRVIHPWDNVIHLNPRECRKHSNNMFVQFASVSFFLPRPGGFTYAFSVANARVFLVAVAGFTAYMPTAGLLEVAFGLFVA